MKDIEKKFIRIVVLLCYFLVYATVAVFFVLYIIGSLPVIRTVILRISIFYLSAILVLVLVIAFCLYIAEVSSISNFHNFKIKEGGNKLISKTIVFVLYVFFSISLFKIDNLLIWFIAFESQNICIYFLLFTGYKSKIKYKAQILQQYLGLSVLMSFIIALLIAIIYLFSGLASFSDLDLFITAVFSDSSNYSRYLGKSIIHIFFFLVQIIFLFKLGLFPFCFIVSNVYKSLDNSSLIFFMSLPKIMYLFAFGLNISEYVDIYIKDSLDVAKEHLYYNFITIESFIILIALLSSIFFFAELYNSKSLKNQIVASSLATTSILFCFLFFSTNIGNTIIYFALYSINISILIALLSTLNINIKVVNKDKSTNVVINILDFDLSLVNKIYLLPSKDKEFSKKSIHSSFFFKVIFIFLFLSILAFPAVPSFSLKLLLSSDLLFSTIGINMFTLFFFIFLTLGPLAYFKNLFSIVFNKKTVLLISDNKDSSAIENNRYIYYITSSISRNQKLFLIIVINFLIGAQLIIPKILVTFF